METAVIVATYRRPRDLERLLRNLAAGAFPDRVRIWVVENGPRTGVEAACRDNPIGGRVRYLYRPQGNKALALNHAIQECGADFLIFLDDDVTVPPDLIQAYVEAAGRRGPGHFFGGGLTADAEVECPAHLRPYLPRSARGWSYSAVETEIPLSRFDFFFGANWAAFRHDLEACGLFAPELGISESRYSSVGEETELQRRLLYRGARAIYVPDATILHPVPAECYTLSWLWRRRFRLGVAEWLTEHGSAAAARPRSALPLWVLRALARQKLHTWSAILAGGGLEARTESRMEEAHLTGLLYGAWKDRASRRAQARAGHRAAAGPAVKPARGPSNDRIGPWGAR